MKMRRIYGPKITFIGVIILILSSMHARAQMNQAFEEYGVGPRDAAMGNAFTGVADDFSAAFYNPAGLTQPKDLHLTFGYKFLQPMVTAEMGDYDPDHFTKDYPETQWGLVGMTTDLYAPEIINPKFSDPFSLGLAVALCNFVHSYSNYYDEYTPYYFRYHDRPVSLLSAYFSLGIRITDWLSIGGGMVMAPSNTKVDARVHTDVYLPDGDFVSSQGIVSRSKSVMDPLAGILLKIPVGDIEDRIRIGLSWRDEVIVIDGNGEALNRIKVRVPDSEGYLSPVPTQRVPVKTMSGYTPTQITFGLSVIPYKGALISSDTIWKHWSAWQNYFYHEPDPSFEDTVQSRLGLEQQFFTEETQWLERWALRAGWYYEPSPVPGQDGPWNILDNDKHVTTAGFGLRLDRILGIIKTPVNLDANGQAHWLVPQTIENDNDPSFPKIKTGGVVYSGTAAVEISW